MLLAGLVTGCTAASPLPGTPTAAGTVTAPTPPTAPTPLPPSTPTGTPTTGSTGPAEPGAGAGWTALLLPTSDRPADHPGPAAQRAMTGVGSVRATGTFPSAGEQLASDSVSILHDGLIGAREIWVEDGQGGVLGYLGVDGRWWDKRLGRADADHDSATWRPLDALGVGDTDRLIAAEQTRVGGRLEAVDYLLAVPEPQPADSGTVDGRPATLWTGRAPIETLYPDHDWGTARSDVAGWDVQVWVTDDGRPARLRTELVDRAGRALGTTEETYVYDDPGAAVPTPTR